MIDSSTGHDATRSVTLRPPEQVMRLSRMGCAHQTRLSFMRVLLRRLRGQGWRFDRPMFDFDATGVGTATYRAIGPERTYTLVCFGHDLPDDMRTDRVIAEAWDATFALFDGEPDAGDLERLSRQVPLQSAGRISRRELVLCRANRSVRLFEHVVERLATGHQPDRDAVEAVGYLMRTTAVYGSGKFGAADRDEWRDRSEFTGSYQPELLAVWLVRAFTADLVEHLARIRAPEHAVTLEPATRRRLGIGNSTGLGMGPYLVNHPELLHRWVWAREEALARVRALPSAGSREAAAFGAALDRARRTVGDWKTAHELQAPRVTRLREDLDAIGDYVGDRGLERETPWDRLYRFAEDHLSVEAQELVVSLALESNPTLVDPLADGMQSNDPEPAPIDGAMTVGALREITDAHYGWTGTIDFGSRAATARIWYTSEEKLEPRLGERYDEPLDDFEQPVAPARDVAAMRTALAQVAPGESVGEFVRRNPGHRYAVRRVQNVARSPYGEIRDNTIDADLLPIDLLRFKLAFFGATRFDPRSDRWVRITMYQDAPYPHELHDRARAGDDW